MVVAMRLPIDPEIAECVDQLDLGFNRYGIDPFGVSKEHLTHFFTLLGWFDKSYFRVTAHNLERVPDKGRAMVVGNHSGGLPVYGGMVLTCLLLEHKPPRLAHGMVEKFAQLLPFVSTWFSRVGQFTGLPEHAISLLEDERILMVFPEGARGTGKFYSHRYELVGFGTGFMRLALQTGTPIVPFAFIGGEEALPTKFHLKPLAKMLGVPYLPIPSYLIPFPMPIACDIYYGEPLRFDGTGVEADRVIEGYVDRVKARIVELIDQGRQERRRRLDRVLPLGEVTEDDFPGESD